MELHPEERIVLGLESREEVLIERCSCVRLHIPEISEQSALLEVLSSDCEVMIEIDHSLAIFEMVLQILRNSTIEDTARLYLDCVSNSYLPINWRNCGSIVSARKICQ